MLIAIPKDPNANSYVTQVDATAYLLGSRLYATEWNAATTENREKALIWATTILEATMNWDGAARTLTQRLRWPRVGPRRPDGSWYDYDTVPDVVQYATAELAYALIKKDRTVEPAVLGLGLSSASVGSLKAEIDPKMVLSLIPDYIVVMLRFVGSPQFLGGSAMQQVKVQRS